MSIFDDRSPAEKLADAVEDFLFTAEGTKEDVARAWYEYVEAVDKEHIELNEQH